MKRRKNQSSTLIVADRIRKIGKDGFAFIPNRFLRDGFFAALRADELLLYFLLVIAANRNGLSFYHYDSLCELLRWPVERYIEARAQLIAKDLIAFDGSRFQVLELSDKPPPQQIALTNAQLLDEHDPATIRALIQGAVGREE